MMHILCVILALNIYGCTYHSQSEEPKVPVTYQGTQYRDSASIGLLRRLVIMPVVHEPYKDEYASAKEQESAAQSFQKACADFLADKKGYEIITIKDVEGKWVREHIGVTNSLESQEDSNLNILYQQWHEEAAGKHTEQIIQKIGRTLNTDGVVAIWVKEREGWDFTDAILNITFMNAPLFHCLASPNIGAWIYESSSGQLVWSEEHSTCQSDSARNEPEIWLVSLFTDMENAIPYQLIR